VFRVVGEMSDTEGAADGYVDVADVVRYWGESLPFLYAVDEEAAMIGDAGILSGAHDVDEDAVVVSEGNLAGAIFGLYLGTYWQVSTELHVAEPDPLPKHYDWFRRAALHAILHDRAGVDLHAEVETDSGARVSGAVCEIRQPFVAPSTNDFTLETSLFLDTGDDVISVGGPGSFLEDYEAEAVTLREAPEG
jgi:hypothetical protein